MPVLLSQSPLPFGPETGPASMISSCSCPPQLAGCQRTTGSLYNSNSDGGPEEGGSGAASRSAMLLRFKVSLAAEEHVLHCFSGLIANFAKFSFWKDNRRPAATCRGQPHSYDEASIHLSHWICELQQQRRKSRSPRHHSGLEHLDSLIIFIWISIHIWSHIFECLHILTHM